MLPSSLVAAAAFATAATTVATEIAVVPKMEELRCIELEVSRSGSERRTTGIIVTSMPEQAPMATDPSTTHRNHDRQQHIIPPSQRRRASSDNRGSDGLTARQVVGGIAVAVLVAVV